MKSGPSLRLSRLRLVAFPRARTCVRDQHLPTRNQAGAAPAFWIK